MKVIVHTCTNTTQISANFYPHARTWHAPSLTARNIELEHETPKLKIVALYRVLHHVFSVSVWNVQSTDSFVIHTDICANSSSANWFLECSYIHRIQRTCRLDPWLTVVAQQTKYNVCSCSPCLDTLIRPRAKEEESQQAWRLFPSLVYNRILRPQPFSGRSNHCRSFPTSINRAAGLRFLF
jgi:hypothetical protein